MLRSISWFEFTYFLLAVTGAYYLCVLARYYGKKITTFFVGSHGQAQAPGRAKAPAQGEAITRPEQPRLFGKDDQLPGATPELFKVMEKAIVLLKGVVSQGVSAGIDREELIERIRGVLGNYHQLRDTPYKKAIDNFLVRTCSTNFSLVLEDADVDVLWS